MKPTATEPDAVAMRRRAEARLEERRGRARPRAAAADAMRLVHELEVHQIELEMQNEELRAARQEVEASLARYAELFDFAPLGYAMLDGVGTITELNHAGARLLGLARSEARGRALGAQLSVAERPAWRALLQKAARSESAVSAEVHLAREARLLRFTATSLPRAQPTILLAFEDVTEMRDNEAKLARSELTLREIDRRKNDFLAVLAHELRNPLAPIRSSALMLADAAGGDARVRHLQAIIERQAAQLTRLTDELLDVTRITRGKVQLRRERLDFAALVAGTLDDHQAGFEASEVQMTRDLQPGPLWVDADPARLVQSLSNLLSNAVKFTPRGGSVLVTLARRGAQVVLSLRDTGVGIAPELQEHLFEPFVQAPQSPERAAGGLGLGLAMVKGLIELHGGSVVVHSRGVGQGTQATVTLPLVEPPAVRPPVAVEKPALAGRRVLIIDDNADFAETLQLLLAMRGHEVRIALQGASGLVLAASFRPEVVLCDLGLPVMDGYAVASAFRADPTLRHTHLVALSGYVRPELVPRLAQAGFNTQTAKPPELDQLDQIIASAPPLPEAESRPVPARRAPRPSRKR
jgi:two-component system CheB/CheR fusion protein